jgi:hypothetical protein
MTRIDIINYLITNNRYEHYLEIGVRDLDHCFNWIQCPNKTSVDPKFEPEYLPEGTTYDYELTSDNFFGLLDSSELDLPADKKWDIIFIDGLHLADQVDRDIQNSLNHLSEGGTIVLHDCNPPDISHAREEFYALIHDNGVPYAWTGTVWKAIYKYRTSRSDLIIRTVDTDYGVGIIQKGLGKIVERKNPYYEFKNFETSREEHLGLIHPDQFHEIYGRLNP